MEKFNINSRTKFSVIEELNSEFTLCKCYVMAHGKNRNMSYFSKELVESKLNTLNYAPVVGHLFKGEDGAYRLGGHDITFDDDWNMVSLCVPFGVVKPDTYAWETINEYGTDVEYLTSEIILWTGRYPELKEAIYSDDVWFNQSMEIVASQYRPLEEDSNYVEILDYEFSALCLLNKSDNPEENVTPCFINASVSPINFSADEFAAKFEELKSAMNKCFNLQKEGGELDNTNTNEPIVEPVIDNPDAAANGTEPVVEPVVEPAAEPTYSLSDYQLTANEKWDKIRTAVRSLNTVNKESDTWFYLSDYDDNYAYVERNVYVFATDDFTSQVGRIGYSESDNEISLTSSFEEMRVMWLTLDEANSIEEARTNYSAIVAEVETLRPYKLAVEKAERENAEAEIFAKYDSRIGDMPEYKTLKENSSNYDLEQLDRECIMLVGTFAMRETPVVQEETKVEPETTFKFSVENTTKSKKPYGDLFDRYGNNE